MASTSSAGNGKIVSVQSKNNDTFNATDDDNRILGGNGNDTLTGGAGADDIYGGAGDDTINGGAGNDELKGDSGNDTLDGGAGSDEVEGGSGNDVAIYVVSENIGSHDEYDGGAGVDTLRLVLTRDEWMRQDVQSDVARYLAFLAANTNPSGQATGHEFQFTAFGLEATKFEKLEVMVDGQMLDPRDQLADAIDDTATATEDGSVSGNVLANDNVPDLVRSVELVTGPTLGQLTFNADGSYTYVPGAYFNALAEGEIATQTFVYKVTDADGDTDTATVTITITGSNDGPVLAVVSDAGAVTEDAVYSTTGQLTATDPDHGAVLTWSLQGNGAGAYGALSVDQSGHWSYALNNAAANVQALAAGEVATESFTVQVADEHGATALHTVTVTVTGTNDAPVIAAGVNSGAVTEDAVSQATGHLTAVDVDHGAKQFWSVQGGTPSGNADFHFNMDSITIVRNNAILFQDNFSDGIAPPIGPDGINSSYTGIGSAVMTESGGRLHLDSTGAVSFIGVGNPDPVAGVNAIVRTNIDPNSTAGLKSSQNFTVTGVFDLILPDSPRESYGIRLTDRVVGGNGTPPDQLGDNVVEMRVSENAAGELGVRLRQLSFVSDTVTTLESIALAPPSGADQIRLNLTHSTSNVGAVTGTFEYLHAGAVIGTQSFSSVGHIFQGENFVRAELIAAAPAINDSILGGTYGNLTIDQTGTWTYTLDNSKATTQSLAEGQHATDTFTVQVADEHGATDTRVVNIDVTGTNDAPVMQTAAVSRTLGEDSNVTAGNLTATGDGQFFDVDVNDSHAMSAALASATLSNGSAIPAALAAALSNAVAVTLLDPATGDGHGQYRWDFAVANAATQFLGAGQTLTLVYDVTATDNHGASATQQLTVKIGGTNDGPVAVGDAYTTSEDTPLTISASQLLGNDSDVDSGDVLNVLSVQNATNGSVALSDGNVVFTPNANFNGNGSYTYTIADSAGATSTATVNVTVTPVNDAPHAVNDVISAAPRIAVFGGTDGTGSPYGSGGVAADLTALGLFQSVTVLNGSESLSTLLQYDSILAYTNGYGYFSTFGGALADYVDNGGDLVVATFAYQGQPGGTDWGRLETGGYLPFVGYGGNYSSSSLGAYDAAHPIMSGPLSIGSLSGYYRDFVSLSPDAQLVASWADGRPLVAVDGGSKVVGVTLFPNDAYGTVSGSYMQLFGNSLRYAADVSTNVNAGGNEDTLQTISAAKLLQNDSDPDGDPLSIAGVSATSTLGATVTLNGSNIAYDPTHASAIQALHKDETATDSFSYTVSDGHGGTSTATVSLTVVGVNDAPVAVNDTASTKEDTAVSIAVLSNDTDADVGDAQFLVSASGAQHGTVVVSGSNVVYTPSANYNGADSFTYTMKDAAGATSSATVNVAVDPVSDTYTLSNLVFNGSFEQGTTGWTQINGGVDVVYQSGWQAGDGSYSLDLNAFHPGGVQQVLQTTPGVQYTVGFELSKNPGNTDHATVQVSADNTYLTSQSYTFSDANTGADMKWSQQVFSFTATGATTTLSFASTYPTDAFPFPMNAEGPALDEVVMVSNKAISNFTTGAGGDVLQLHDVLSSVSAPHDGAAFSNGYLQFVQSGGDTLIQVDANGGGNSYLTLATLSNTLLTQADTANYVL